MRWKCFTHSLGVVCLVGSVAPAWAMTPMLGYSGRLFDATGTPIDGNYDMTFRIYAEATGGNVQFGQTFDDVPVSDGYFYVLLSENEEGTRLLEEVIWDLDEGYIEISVDGALLDPRQQMAPVPWALVSGNVNTIGTGGSGGGSDTLSKISCPTNGEVLMWSQGTWGCGVITGAGGGGGTDTLAGMSCGNGQVAKFNGSAWICANDADTAAALSCANGQVLKWNGSAWACAADATGAGGAVSWLDLTDLPAGLVELAGDPTLDCAAGDVVRWDGSAWTCAAPAAEVDPAFTASAAAGITSTHVTNWNSAYGWGNHASAGYLTSFTETDPQVGATTNNNWCRGNGSAVVCDQSPPVTAETDPQVGTLTNGRWCTSDGTIITCSQTAPVTAESDPQVGTLTNGRWCTTDGTSVNCTQPVPAASNQSCPYGRVRGIDASGNVTCHTRVGFLARRNSNHVPPDASINQVPFDMEVYDYNNDFNPATGTFTAPVEGWYAFSGAIRVDGVSVGDLYYFHLTAGSRNYGAAGGYVTSTSWNTANASAIVYLTAGQSAYLYGYINSTSGNGYFYGNTASAYQWTYFQGGLIE